MANPTQDQTGSHLIVQAPMPSSSHGWQIIGTILAAAACSAVITYAQVQTLDTRVTAVESSIGEIKKQPNEISNQIDKLSKKIEKLSEEISALKTSIAVIEATSPKASSRLKRIGQGERSAESKNEP